MEHYQLEHHLDTEAIIKRLRRIEGQIRGIISMVGDSRGCDDIITQLSAVNSAVTNTAREILNSHIEHCVEECLETGDAQATIIDLKRSIERFGKLK